MITSHPRLRTGRERGFTLVELLVAIVIGLALIIALAVITSRFEISKRQTSTSTDLSRNSGFLTYDLDRQLRSAGSGLAQNAGTLFGCRLNVSRNNAAILPRPSAFPAPFTNVPTDVRIVPMMVHAGAGANNSDVIQVMTGAGGVSETPMLLNVNGAATGNSLSFANTLGINGGDLVLVAEQSRQDCMVQQVASPFTGGAPTVAPLGGQFFAPVIGVVALNTFGTGVGLAQVSGIGNVTDSRPRFMLLGVNAQQQLVSYDMMRFDNGMATGNDQPVPLAEGVVDLRVRYGISTAGNGIVNAWVLPTTAPYDVATLNAWTNPARTAMQQIVAVQVSMVVRSDRIEQSEVAPASLTLFSNLPAGMQVVRNLSANDRLRNHRVLEFTVPLRNMIVTSNSRTLPP